MFKVYISKKIEKIDIYLVKKNFFLDKTPVFLWEIYDFFNSYIRYGKIIEIDIGLLELSSFKERELQVFLALKNRVKIGETITYKDLALLSGMDKNSARIVGKILSKNNFPIIFPCHRVIRSDGNIGGFKWDIKLKKFLLEKEKKLLKID
ncbi:MAG TPA: MGMT family protein [Spirochaetota bacterium]|nr:MGMT family protein [Spirochaetota bacterium]